MILIPFVTLLLASSPAAAQNACLELCERFDECMGSVLVGGGSTTTPSGEPTDPAEGPLPDGKGEAPEDEPADPLPEEDPDREDEGGDEDGERRDDGQDHGDNDVDREPPNLDACVGSCGALEEDVPGIVETTLGCFGEGENACEGFNRECFGEIEIPACVATCEKALDCGLLERNGMACSGSGGSAGSEGGDVPPEARPAVPDEDGEPQDGGGDDDDEGDDDEAGDEAPHFDDEECEVIEDNTPPAELLAECVAGCTEIALQIYPELLTLSECVDTAACGAIEEACEDEMEALGEAIGDSAVATRHGEADDINGPNDGQGGGGGALPPGLDFGRESDGGSGSGSGGSTEGGGGGSGGSSRGGTDDVGCAVVTVAGGTGTTPFATTVARAVLSLWR